MCRDLSSATPDHCLTQPHAGRYHGGTLIAEDVHDLATHSRRMADPDGYRPARCPRCGRGVLHVHDYPSRQLLDDAGTALICIVRYACANANCGAIWRILPAFVARHLPRSWPIVEQTVFAQEAQSMVAPAAIPQRTVQRWRSRMRLGARQIVLVLAMCIGSLFEEMAKIAGLHATRSGLVDIFGTVTRIPKGRRISALAAAIHRLEPGLRLV